ncbi:MAG: SAM-dependent methyltransferase [Chloroflexi bacterium HGW-Chloroflexi-10]|nr:MAG: SAM-dependent methyltransferase [Chloroflexi bacterium HGW-Chloroflexi-10]
MDWIALWRHLVELGEERRQYEQQDKAYDYWQGRAEDFNQRVQHRWRERDSSRDFLLQTLNTYPDSTVLDIGAGTGDWAIWMARHAKSVTALDPSPSMLDLCRKNVQLAGLSNISFIDGAWPYAQAGVYDICICSHAMYGVADFPGFIVAMQKAARKRCILLIRAPHPQGIMGKASRLVHGHPYDSPNFQIAYQILLEMGIFANVLFEEGRLWKPWRSPDLDAALQDLKSRLGIMHDPSWDAELTDILKQNIQWEDGMLVWPRAVRTALIWWNIDS